MQNNWDILKKELSCNCIELLDEKNCSWSLDSKKYKSRILTKIALLKKNFNKNESLILDLIKSTVKALEDKTEDTTAFDENHKKLFIHSVLNLKQLYNLILEDSPSIYKKLLNSNFEYVIKKSLNSDICEFSTETIKVIPCYKITLDWAYRRNCKIIYLIKLLRYALKGCESVNLLKTARGVEGPMSRVDLAMPERVFSWRDIEEEVQGRETSKETQQRYRKGLETYNKSDKVGEGYYWREIRNEPYSWSNRFTESPYPQLQDGTWR